MMLSKVKPLHTKVEETSKTVSEASGKLSVLNNKLKDLETRLSSLARAYEEACIDKCRQKELTEKLNLQLERADHFDKVRYSNISNIFQGAIRRVYISRLMATEISRPLCWDLGSCIARLTEIIIM